MDKVKGLKNDDFSLFESSREARKSSRNQKMALAVLTKSLCQNSSKCWLFMQIICLFLAVVLFMGCLVLFSIDLHAYINGDNGVLPILILLCLTLIVGMFTMIFMAIAIYWELDQPDQNERQRQRHRFIELDQM